MPEQITSYKNYRKTFFKHQASDGSLLLFCRVRYTSDRSASARKEWVEKRRRRLYSTDGRRGWDIYSTDGRTGWDVFKAILALLSIRAALLALKMKKAETRRLAGLQWHPNTNWTILMMIKSASIIMRSLPWKRQNTCIYVASPSERAGCWQSITYIAIQTLRMP